LLTKKSAVVAALVPLSLALILALFSFENANAQNDYNNTIAPDYGNKSIGRGQYGQTYPCTTGFALSDEIGKCEEQQLQQQLSSSPSFSSPYSLSLPPSFLSSYSCPQGYIIGANKVCQPIMMPQQQGQQPLQQEQQEQQQPPQGPISIGQVQQLQQQFQPQQLQQQVQTMDPCPAGYYLSDTSKRCEMLIGDGQPPQSPMQPQQAIPQNPNIIQNTRLNAPTNTGELINQISTMVVSANPGYNQTPGTNQTDVRNLLNLLATQMAQTLGEDKALEGIRQIYGQALYYTRGTTVQALDQLTQQKAKLGDSSTMIQQIISQNTNTGFLPQSIVNVAVQLTAGNNSAATDIVQKINQTAQLISSQTQGVSANSIDSVIRQISLQTAKTGGADLSASTVSEIEKEIKLNPKGPLAMSIVKLAKLQESDMGRSGDLLRTIKIIVSGTGDSGNNKENRGKSVVAKMVNTPIPPPQSPSALGTSAGAGAFATPPGALGTIPAGSSFFLRADGQWVVKMPNGVIAGPFPMNTAFQRQADGSTLILDPFTAPVWPPLPSDLQVPCFPSINPNCPPSSSPQGITQSGSSQLQPLTPPLTPQQPGQTFGQPLPQTQTPTQQLSPQSPSTNLDTTSSPEPASSGNATEEPEVSPMLPQSAPINGNDTMMVPQSAPINGNDTMMVPQSAPINGNLTEAGTTTQPVVNQAKNEYEERRNNLKDIICNDKKDDDSYVANVAVSLGISDDGKKIEEKVGGIGSGRVISSEEPDCEVFNEDNENDKQDKNDDDDNNNNDE
jgi:hypothetical protein